MDAKAKKMIKPASQWLKSHDRPLGFQGHKTGISANLDYLEEVILFEP